MAIDNTNAKAASVCAGYSSGVYTCPGHSGLRPDNVPEFSDYDKGDIVETPDLNKLRQVIQVEIDRRKQHIWYRNGKNGITLNGLTLDDVSEGDLIDHPQQNDVAECVNTLNTLINLYNPSDTQNGQKRTDLPSIPSGKLIETEDLKEIEEALAIVTTDCICYSDCTNHCGSNCAGYGSCGSNCASYCRWYSTCSCDANCCHYGWW